MKNYLRGSFLIAGEKINYLRGSFALACPICFRVEESATTDGAQAAVLVLLAVTAVVLGAFARFIFRFAKRDGGQ